MQWENLTAPDFAAAVRQTGVCILTFGVLERHSEHLPLGTDYLNVHRIASLAAEQEPAVVFPPFYFGQIYEARCHPGTFTVRPTLLLEVIQSVLDEIGRNGFGKIILVNGHGGNAALLPFIIQTSLFAEKPYKLYLFHGDLGAEREQVRKQTLETELHAHACECETSITLANFPELVHMERVPPQPAEPLGRLDHLKNNHSAIGWYANFPEHYAGDARSASVEKGRVLRQLSVDALAEFIAAVKADPAVSMLEGQFFDQERKLR